MGREVLPDDSGPGGQLYVIRILAAAMEKAGREQGVGGLAGAEHVGVILFVLKLIVANMSDFAQTSAAARSGALSRAGSAAALGGGGGGGGGGGSASRGGRSVQDQLDEVLAREQLILDLLSAGAHTPPPAAGTVSAGSGDDEPPAADLAPEISAPEGTEGTRSLPALPVRTCGLANLNAKPGPDPEAGPAPPITAAPASPRRDVRFAPAQPADLGLPGGGGGPRASSPRSPPSPQRGRRAGGFSSSMRVRAESDYGALPAATEASTTAASWADLLMARRASLSAPGHDSDANPAPSSCPPEPAAARLDDDTLAALAMADAGLGWTPAPLAAASSRGRNGELDRAGPYESAALPPPPGADSEASRGASMNGSCGEEDSAGAALLGPVTGRDGPARAGAAAGRGSRRSLYSTRLCSTALRSGGLQGAADDSDLVPALPRAGGILRESRPAADLSTRHGAQAASAPPRVEPHPAPRGTGAADAVAAAAAAAWAGVGGGGLLKVLRYPGQQALSTRKV